MNKIILTLITSITFLLISSYSLAQDPPAIHGMLVFGMNKIYLSHLPMFHRPHNYQVIFEANFDSEAKAKYLESLKNFPKEKIYTLVPEKFVLPEMIANPREFSGDLYRGHFERGGTIIIQGLRVKPVKILYQKKFVLAETKPEDSQYLIFGNNEEQFMAHYIVARPDFDHLVQLQFSPALKKILNQQLILKGTILGKQNTTPVLEKEKIELSPNQGDESFEKMSLQVSKEFYLEFGDLE